MSARQQHGLDFEDEIHRVVHGLSKKEYEKHVEGGPTAVFDIQKGCGGAALNAHIKATGSNAVGGSDLLRMYESTQKYSLTFIIGKYTQRMGAKEVFEIYEFYLDASQHHLLWGGMQFDTLEKFVTWVKNIRPGKAAQLTHQPLWKAKRATIYADEGQGVMSINAKIDSKSQRRVQCGFRIQDMIGVGIPYKKFTSEYRGIANFLPQLI
jgi:hypothetical protein